MAETNPTRTNEQPDRVMDALVEGSRVSTEAVIHDEGTLSEAEHGRIRDRYRSFKARRLVNLSMASKGLDVPKSTLAQIIKGTYPTQEDGKASAKVADVLRRLDKWLSNQEAIQEAPQRGECVETVVVKDIVTVARTALLLGTIGVIHGPAGIGKTLALRALLDLIPGALLVTASDSSASVCQFFAELCKALRLQDAWHKAGMRRVICDRLRDTRRLLVIDEAHLLSPAVLNAARQLHDETGCPLLLCGLPALARNLVEGRSDEGMGATLYSRVGISRDLTERCKHGTGRPLFSVEEVKAVFAHSAIRIAGDGQAWLHDVANIPEIGGLRNASNALRMAIHLIQTGRRNDTEITASLLRDATQLLHGVERAKGIANRMNEQKGVA